MRKRLFLTSYVCWALFIPTITNESYIILFDTQQGSGATVEHPQQRAGGGPDLRGVQVRDGGDPPGAQQLPPVHERVGGGGRNPPDARRRDPHLVRREQLHLLLEGTGGQVNSGLFVMIWCYQFEWWNKDFFKFLLGGVGVLSWIEKISIELD